MPHPPPTRACLLARLRDPRDGEAWRPFVDLNAALVFGWLRGRGLQVLEPADFRAAGDAAKFGADVDRVGPGKPYHDWKKTPRLRPVAEEDAHPARRKEGVTSSRLVITPDAKVQSERTRRREGERQMSPSATVRLMTAEEFAELPNPPDGSQQELVKGMIVSEPLPDFIHGVCCACVGGCLAGFVHGARRGVVTNKCGVILARNPDTVRGPDVAFWSRDRLPELPRRGYPNVAPDLVVEILSPSDVFTKVQKKVQDYLNAGARLIWILVPEDRSIAVFRAGKPSSVLTNGETLSGEDVLAGFSCPIAELFP
jgi:Uma2 family endonuclease